MKEDDTQREEQKETERKTINNRKREKRKEGERSYRMSETENQKERDVKNTN